jgi:hypothetical protein
VWDGVLWVPTTPLANAITPGRVKIGTNVQIAVDGTISILPTTGLAGSVSNAGVTTITDNVASLSIDSALSANQGRLLQNQINALLIANNLTLAGIISGGGLMTYVTPEGALQGFVLGAALPVASVSNEGYFVIIENAGGFTPPGGAFTVVTQGDWFLSSLNTWQFLNVGYDPPYATDTVPGIIEIATQAETNAGLDFTRAVTPLTLIGFISSGGITASNITVSPAINGNTNVQSALADAVYDITSTGLTITITSSPTGLFNIEVAQATEAQLGGAEIATQAETETGTDDTRIVTPLKLRTAAVYKSDFNAKGDLLSAAANDTPLILGVGTDGQVLTADSTAATGLKWNTVPTFVNLDDVSAGFDGVTTSFPLSIGAVPYTPSPSTNIMVFVGGVAQVPGAGNAYIIAGSNISFTSAPPTGATFYATTVK